VERLTESIEALASASEAKFKLKAINE